MKHLSFVLLSFFAVLTFSCTKMSKEATPSLSSPLLLTDSTSSDTTVNLSRGLLLYLPFNGSFADSSGNGNTTTVYDTAALVTDEHGYTNSALGGDGNGGVVVVTNNGSIVFDTAFSVSFHFMTKSPSTEQVFFSMINYSTGHAPIIEIGTGTTTDSSAVHHYLNFAYGDTTIGCSSWGAGEMWGVNSTWSPLQYAWYEFTGVFNKGKVDEYINGQLIGTYTSTTFKKADACSSSNVVIGGWWSSAPNSFNGKIDAVRLYGRALNSNEIAKLAASFQLDTKVHGGVQNGQSNKLQ